MKKDALKKSADAVEQGEKTINQQRVEFGLEPIEDGDMLLRKAGLSNEEKED